jgi:hypothetical protein
MGKLAQSACRVLGTGVLVLAGAWVLLLSGAGIATAQPASASASADACDNIFTVFDQFNAMPSSPSLKETVAFFTTGLTKAEAGTSPAVMSTVAAMLADLRADEATGKINRPKIVTDGDAIIAACAATPAGAPATGGGSTVGVQYPALFGVGGALLLAGIGVAGLALRGRPRHSPSQG